MGVGVRALDLVAGFFDPIFPIASGMMCSGKAPANPALQAICFTSAMRASRLRRPLALCHHPIASVSAAPGSTSRS